MTAALRRKAPVYFFHFLTQGYLSAVFLARRSRLYDHIGYECHEQCFFRGATALPVQPKDMWAILSWEGTPLRAGHCSRPLRLRRLEAEMGCNPR